jgi:hypothetical protein
MQFDKVLEKDSVKSLFSPKETLVKPWWEAIFGRGRVKTHE